MKSNSWSFDTHGAPSEVLSWREQELPAPGPGQAWVKINAIGLNLSDFNYVLGQHFPTDDFPSCLGNEAVGEVIALGPATGSGDEQANRLTLEIGTRVGTLSGRINRTSMGVYRDVGLYEQASLLPVPESYTDEEGAAFWTSVITVAGAMEMGGFTAETSSDKRVLITAGGSGMGGLALKLGKHWGATTIATTRKADKLDELKKRADHVIVCGDSANLQKAVSQVTNGEGVDLVLDPVGAAFYPGLLAAVARGGSIVSYECITGTQVNLSIMDMMMKGVSLHGYTTFQPLYNPAMLDRLIAIGLDNSQALRPTIDQVFNLSQVPNALETLGKSEHIGKMVIKT